LVDTVWKTENTVLSMDIRISVVQIKQWKAGKYRRPCLWKKWRMSETDAIIRWVL